MGETASTGFTDIQERIKKDPQYIRTMDLFKAMCDLDVEELHDEILEYQRKRGDRPPLALKTTPKKSILKFSSEDASYRSRVTYVRSIARREANKMEHLVGIFRDWIFATYLRGVKGTVQEKGAFASMITNKLDKRLAELSSLDESCIYCLEDIDQSQWQRKAIVSVLEIQSRPEGKL